ncbi:MAG: DUF3307 domain-containing protein [Proteiniphilum sp.]|jgi:hypothetical protein|uniref:DUF3307 domain-containing protein n=1 Tax=Proteiniphilum sp. TaxID=1926877 RepID=UPI00092AAE06|nr:DUF3307 domain-containing protein [Proteiniphilum sp.]MEA5127156.1 DUF3307 domain-containing protein [Proteiniphilum sp.]OJV75883.1 MAG: hypothetical protein BGO34_01745 [Bacteroidia bacterium 44-10]
MTLLIKLILAHFIGDFLLQPKSWVKEKETKKLKSPKFYLHILLHGVVYLLILWDWNYWLLALLLMSAHGIIDIIKLYAQKENNKPKWFLIDQGLHIITILVLWYIWSGLNFKFQEWFENVNVWGYLTAILFLTVVSSIIIQVLMSNWSKALNDNNDASLSNAGKYIGILERLFVFTFIMTGNWAAIGFLLAAKSVFRFGDLRESKDRKLTEYILIGTLLSFGIAVATAMLMLELQ